MNRLHLWRRWIRPLVMFVYIVILVVALPLMIVEFHENKTDAEVQFWFIGGLFVLLSLPISLWGILQHLVHYTEPLLQRHIIRILWMVPVYAINSWFALKFPKTTIYLDSIRECYEAYVIYNFMSYLLNYLRMEHPDLDAYIATKPQVKHLPPACCLSPWRMGTQFVERCKHGVMQYTVMRPLTTFIAFSCYMAGENFYGEGEFNFRSAWSYLVIVNNISQIFAMYCLILFYKATRTELSPIRPVAKFLCVKAVVFLSFWQSILIAILVNSGAIKLEKDVVKTKAALVLQDLCICIEMFLAAIAHYFSFSYRPFVDLAADPQDCFTSFKSMWDISDVHKDVVEHIRHVGSTATGVLTSPLQVGRPVRVAETELTPLLSGDEGLLPSTPELSACEATEANLFPRGEKISPQNNSETFAPTKAEKSDAQNKNSESSDARLSAANGSLSSGRTIAVLVEVHKADDHGSSKQIDGFADNFT